MALPLVAAGLAVVPLAISRIDGDGDLDPFFAVLAVAALVVAALLGRVARRPTALRLATAIAVAWWIAAVWAAVLLAMYQAACACSRVDPASLPPPSTIAGLPVPALATVTHVLATYGGGLLVAGALVWARFVARATRGARPEDPPSGGALPSGSATPGT